MFIHLIPPDHILAPIKKSMESIMTVVTGSIPCAIWLSSNVIFSNHSKPSELRDIDNLISSHFHVEIHPCAKEGSASISVIVYLRSQGPKNELSVFANSILW